jgi:23S rRNA pseudouridine1911/1915/1917 synthase
MISDAILLFESDALIAFDKPARVHSHALKHSPENTMVGHLLALYPEQAQHKWDNPLELGLLHRLDYETSGVLLFTKHLGAYRLYKEAWKSPRIRKFYSALVSHPGELKEGLEIQDSLAHAVHHKSKMVSQKDKKFKRGEWLKAHTKILRISPHGAKFKIDIEILTGVTHQIRCHLASYGAPILGDPLYGDTAAERMYLNASELVIDHLRILSKNQF